MVAEVISHTSKNVGELSYPQMTKFFKINLNVVDWWFLAKRNILKTSDQNKKQKKSFFKDQSTT